jgi:predicted metallopeptidase
VPCKQEHAEVFEKSEGGITQTLAALAALATLKCMKQAFERIASVRGGTRKALWISWQIIARSPHRNRETRNAQLEYHRMSTVALPLVYHWDQSRPPPRLALRLSARAAQQAEDPPSWLDTGLPEKPFDLSRALRSLSEDMIAHTPTLAHIDVSRLLFSITRARNGRGHGLQARVTPLRFRGGALATIHRGNAYQVQRFIVDGHDILYVVTFCLPRFMNREFEDKLVTVFHELYHISPAFDGDLRRHDGRYSAHTGSQKKYDAHMSSLAKAYLKNGADPTRLSFLRLSFGQLCRRHGSVIGMHLPRPKLVRVAFTPPRQPAQPTGPSPSDTR